MGKSVCGRRGRRLEQGLQAPRGLRSDQVKQRCHSRLRAVMDPIKPRSGVRSGTFHSAITVNSNSCRIFGLISSSQRTPSWTMVFAGRIYPVDWAQRSTLRMSRMNLAGCRGTGRCVVHRTRLLRVFPHRANGKPDARETAEEPTTLCRFR